MTDPQAAYGLFYVDNRPTLLRALELTSPPSGAGTALLDSARAWGFNAVRGWPDSARDAARDAGLAVIGPSVSGLTVDQSGPFGVSLQAARASAGASEEQPAAVWGLRPSLADVASAVARSARAYSIRVASSVLENPAPRGVAEIQAWVEAHEEELTASAEVRDSLAYLDYAPFHRPNDPLQGVHAVLATAGYNPTLLDLRTVADDEVSQFPAGIFPSRGAMEVEDYGKLVVFTLRGGTLVTFPEPVRRQPNGAPFKSTFLWPRNPEPARRTWRDALPWSKKPAQEVGYSAQVRDGISTLLTTVVGEPYTSDAYARLPAAQRVAHRDLVTSLFETPVPRAFVPDRELEVELVARLSPDGGALLFILNRLGAQTGQVRIAAPEALDAGSPPLVETEFSALGSTAVWSEGALSLRMEAGDALILRLT
jgi:hypothetical protein